MSRCLKLSADYICGISFSLWWYVEIILQIRTRFKCSVITLEYSEMEPALQCRRQSMCPTHRHWSLVQVLLWESWTKGSSDSCTIYFGRVVGLWRYKIKTSIGSGWDSPLRVRQAWWFRYVDSFLCNRPYVTLSPSGVYINGMVLVLRTEINIPS